MSSGTNAVSLPTLQFRLPGQWHGIPLHDREEARRSLERLIEQQVGKADIHATLRRDLRGRLAAALQDAIDGDGQSMYVALSVVPEVPISASFTVFLPAVTLTPSIGVTPKAVMDLFQQGLAASTDMESASRFGTSESEVLRLQRRHIGQLDADHDEIDTLIVDYWVTIPGLKRVVLVSFSTLYIEIADIMLTFFDSIVRASYWQHVTSD